MHHHDNDTSRTPLHARSLLTPPDSPLSLALSSLTAITPTSERPAPTRGALLLPTRHMRRARIHTSRAHLVAHAHMHRAQFHTRAVLSLSAAECTTSTTALPCCARRRQRRRFDGPPRRPHARLRAPHRSPHIPTHARLSWPAVTTWDATVLSTTAVTTRTQACVAAGSRWMARSVPTSRAGHRPPPVSAASIAEPSCPTLL